jgi:hypothetical protein
MPERVVLSRAKGWRKPPDTVVVARPSKWGNPYTLDLYRADYSGDTDDDLRRMAVSDFRGLVEGRWDRFDDAPAYPPAADIRRELAGKNLACWCKGPPCHADVLLEIANS